MKRFWSFKRGEQFWVGTALMTKTGVLGCADRFGNLYGVLPWTRLMPASDFCQAFDRYLTGRPSRLNDQNIHGT